MSDLSRLRELGALLLPKPVAEGSKPVADLKPVQDALDRLKESSPQVTDLVNKFKLELLSEMAAIHKMNSGFLKTKDARELVRAFKAGEDTVELANGDSYKRGGKANAAKIAKGDVLFGSYNSSNQGAEVFEVLGLSDWEKKYGDGGVKFDSVDDALKAKGADNLKALFSLYDDREYGQYIYLMVKSLDDGDEWRMYLNEKGQWCRGSGEEPVSFVKIEKV